MASFRVRPRFEIESKKTMDEIIQLVKEKLKHNTHKMCIRDRYTGVILIFLGLTFYSLSVYKFIITCSLVILFYFKSAYELSLIHI